MTVFYRNYPFSEFCLSYFPATSAKMTTNRNKTEISFLVYIKSFFYSEIFEEKQVLISIQVFVIFGHLVFYEFMSFETKAFEHYTNQLYNNATT